VEPHKKRQQLLLPNLTQSPYPAGLLLIGFVQEPFAQVNILPTLSLADPTLSLSAKSGLQLTRLTNQFLPLLAPYLIWPIWSVTHSLPYLTLSSLLPYRPLTQFRLARPIT
jgi:hypothetical protein